MESQSDMLKSQKQEQKTAFVHPAYPASDFIPVGHLVQVPASNPAPQPIYCKREIITTKLYFFPKSYLALIDTIYNIYAERLK